MFQKSKEEQSHEIILVSHTHWDREWYLSFEQFRMNLVSVIDELLGVLSSQPDFSSFILDGQTVALEDYLAIRSEKESVIREFVVTGRLHAGPWYTLPDEFLVSGEAIIRNLMLGHMIAERFGRVMKIGYVPDSFGHIPQLPQILRGFGIDSFIFMRGMGDRIKPLKSEFYWQALDGSKVLAVWLRHGYVYGARLPGDEAELINKLRGVMVDMAPLATSGTILLCNGYDHLPVQAEIPHIIEMANRILPEVKLIHGTFEDYLERVRTKSPRLDVIDGELRCGKYQHIVPNVLSARMYIKQENAKTQMLLEKWAEPFSTFSWMLGDGYPREFIWQAWKYLLQNHCHDSICGCSVDEVHQDMMRRFAWSGQIAGRILEEAFRKLTGGIDTTGSGTGDVSLVVFNALNWPCTEPVTACLDFPERLGVEGFRLYDVCGQEVPFVLNGKEKVKKLRKELREPPEYLPFDRFTVTFIARDVPPCGYKAYAIVFGKPHGLGDGLKRHGGKPGKNEIENEYFRVAAQENGTLIIIDKKTGKNYAGCNLVEDREDAGDVYAYSPAEAGAVITNRNEKAEISVIEDNEVRKTLRVTLLLRIPESLSYDGRFRARRLVRCPFTSHISLYQGVPRIDISTSFNNRARDHRLRVLFPTGLDAEYSYAEGQFGVVRRPVEIPCSEGWVEYSEPTHPQLSFVDITGGKAGLAIANRGLPEYEAVKEDGQVTIALTLLRSVGVLLRKDLAVRPVSVDLSLPVPGAQCLGPHIFEYSIIPHEGTWDQARVYKQAHQYATPLRAFTTGRHSGTLPPELGFISIQPDSLVVTGLKKAENRESLIVRFYNISQETVEGRIKLFKPVRKARPVNMNEEPIDEQPINEPGHVCPELDAGGNVRLPVKAGQIITLELSLNA